MLKFNYKNHRGEIRERTVQPIGLIFVRNPGYGYQPGWFLHAEDLDKKKLFVVLLWSISFFLMIVNFTCLSGNSLHRK